MWLGRWARRSDVGDDSHKVACRSAASARCVGPRPTQNPIAPGRRSYLRDERHGTGRGVGAWSPGEACLTLQPPPPHRCFFGAAGLAEATSGTTHTRLLVGAPPRRDELGRGRPKTQSRRGGAPTSAMNGPSPVSGKACLTLQPQRQPRRHQHHLVGHLSDALVQPPHLVAVAARFGRFGNQSHPDLVANQQNLAGQLGE